MNIIRRIFLLALCAALAAGAVGCARTSPETAPSEPSATAPAVTVPPEKQYAAARKALAGAENLILQYTVSETRQMTGNTFARTVQGTASISGVGREEMLAVVEEQLAFGSFESAYREVYCGGAAFAQVNGTAFRTDMPAADFMARQLPAALLDEALYGAVAAQPGEDSVELTFSQPKGPESWAVPQRAELTDASGTAVLDLAGNLIQSLYRAEYTLDGVTYALEVTLRVTAPKALNLEALHQDHFENAISAGDVRTAKMLLQVAFDIYSAEALACTETESIYSAAIPMTYTQERAIRLSGAGDALTAAITQTQTLSGYQGEIFSQSQSNTYEGGILTTTVAGGKPTGIAMPARQMRSFCEDAILSGLMAPTYISDARLREDDRFLYLTLDGSGAFVTDLVASLEATLNMTLEGEGQQVRTAVARGTLTVDKATQLPVSMGLELVRVCTVGAEEFELRYKLQQSLSFGAPVEE